MNSTTTTLDTVMNGLMSRYQERVPDVMAIINAMVSEGLIEQPQDIENDHIAFRTLGVPHLGIASFEKIFLHYGYQKRDYYKFEGKKLDAFWFSPPEPHYPGFLSVSCGSVTYRKKRSASFIAIPRK